MQLSVFTRARRRTPELTDYCARCGRVERLDPFGLCLPCRSREDVIEIDTESDSETRPVSGPAPGASQRDGNFRVVRTSTG